jgi:hypothetical protein
MDMEIEQRLRNYADNLARNEAEKIMASDAADEIERLRKENVKMYGVLIDVGAAVDSWRLLDDERDDQIPLRLNPPDLPAMSRPGWLQELLRRRLVRVPLLQPGGRQRGHHHARLALALVGLSPRDAAARQVGG